jgi:hypothetical protein
MTVTASPPRWADLLLRVALRSGDFNTVSGDLLEEYRETVHPARGQRRADFWYVRQVLGFVWRGARLWAALFAAAFIARTAIDWLAPTTDFHFRSTVSTILGVGILLLAGFWTSLRSGSFVAGTVIGIATVAIAAPIAIVGAGALLAVWHDPMTIAAIRGSGGLEEVFTLPLLMAIPGVVLATVGGIFGAAVNKLRSA